MDAATYDEWCDTIALLKLLTLREAEARAGHVVPHETAMARASAIIDEIEASHADAAEHPKTHKRPARKTRA